MLKRKAEIINQVKIAKIAKLAPVVEGNIAVSQLAAAGAADLRPETSREDPENEVPLKENESENEPSKDSSINERNKSDLDTEEAQGVLDDWDDRSSSRRCFQFYLKKPSPVG